MEAALLTLEMTFVILLIWSINKSTKPRADKSLGIFQYKKSKTDIDTDLRETRVNKKNA